jgi:hypothetical protein
MGAGRTYPDFEDVENTDGGHPESPPARCPTPPSQKNTTENTAW